MALSHKSGLPCFFTDGMLQIDPANRPSIKDVIERLEEIAAARETDLKGPPKLGLSLPKSTPVTSHPPTNFHKGEEKLKSFFSFIQYHLAFLEEPLHNQVDKMNLHASRRPEELNHHGQPGHSTSAAAAGGGLFGSLKSQAGGLFKNIKDTSSKVMQTVQA